MYNVDFKQCSCHYLQAGSFDTIIDDSFQLLNWRSDSIDGAYITAAAKSLRRPPF